MTIQIGDNFRILKNRETIGHFELITGGDTLTIQNIEIEKQYRNNGYSTKAIKELITHAEENNYKTIRTNHVINWKMEQALKSNNFKIIEEELDERTAYKYTL